MTFSYAVNTLSNPLNNGLDKRNQDNYLIQTDTTTKYLNNEQSYTETDNNSNKSCLAIFDGIASLENSAHLTTQLCHKLANRDPNSQSLQTFIDSSHSNFQEKYNLKINTAGTTLTILEFCAPRTVNLVHIGDSRLFEIDNKQVTNLTIDASESNQCLILDNHRQEEINSQTSNLLLHAFAVGNNYRDKLRNGRSYKQLSFLTERNLPQSLKHLADVRSLSLSADNYYLLATDGLFDLVNAEEFITQWPKIIASNRVQSLNSKLNTLFQKLSEHLNNQHAYYADNATAILFRVC